MELEYIYANPSTSGIELTSRTSGSTGLSGLSHSALDDFGLILWSIVGSSIGAFRLVADVIVSPMTTSFGTVGDKFITVSSAGATVEAFAPLLAFTSRAFGVD